jgi:hypothetical protein
MYNSLLIWNKKGYCGSVIIFSKQKSKPSLSLQWVPDSTASFKFPTTIGIYQGPYETYERNNVEVLCQGDIPIDWKMFIKNKIQPIGTKFSYLLFRNRIFTPEKTSEILQDVNGVVCLVSDAICGKVICYLKEPKSCSK